MQAKSVKGALKVHAVNSLNHGEIYVRNTSCTKSCCLTGVGEFMPSCPGWIQRKTCTSHEDHVPQEETAQNVHLAEHDTTEMSDYSRGDDLNTTLQRDESSKPHYSFCSCRGTC